MNVQQIDTAPDVQAQTAQAPAGARRGEPGVQAERTDTVRAANPDSGETDRKKAEDAKNMAAIAQQAGAYFQAKGVDLHFKVLDNNEAVQVEMVREGTGKVLCKIPGDEVIKLRENMKRMAKGVRDVTV